jgi:hypothetical protein
MVEKKLILQTLLKPCIKIADLVTDIIYISTTDFYNEELFYASIAFLIIQPLVVMIHVSYQLYKEKDHAKQACCICICCAPIFLPIISVCSEWILYFKFSHDNIEYLKNYYMKQIGFIDCYFESLPQLIIQSINNSIMDEWSTLSIISASFSCAMMAYSLLQFCIAFVEYGKKVIRDDETPDPETEKRVKELEDELEIIRKKEHASRLEMAIQIQKLQEFENQHGRNIGMQAIYKEILNKL